MPLAAGTRLGPYEIVAPLGEGGMGEVYKARDTRLRRDVALKVLPASVTGDAAARERFEREARLIAQLQHPHICVLHDVGHEGETLYLVMELLTGETLDARLARGRMPFDDALAIAAQIAQALDAAHRHGIVHRDLKPANVMLVKGASGTDAKLLDFGVARPAAATPRAVQHAGDATGATTAAALTDRHMLVGTLPYMAPEQLGGQPVDARTDLWALGCVLYEMLTGTRPFAGQTTASLMAAILEHPPQPLTERTPLTPPLVDHLVRRCLEKDPERRWQSARDVAIEIEWSKTRGDEGAVPPTPRNRLVQWSGWMCAATLAAALAGTWLYGRDTRVSNPRVMRLSIPAPDNATFMGGRSAPYFALSPDATQLAFVPTPFGRSAGVWARDLDSTTARLLPDTAGATFPFWSPDGSRVGFFADGKLKVVDVRGGRPRTICDAPASRGGTWNQFDDIVFSPRLDSALYRVAASGGSPVAVTTLNGERTELNHKLPAFLPDGRRFLFVNQTGNAATTGVYLGSLDSPETSRLLDVPSKAQFADGFLWYAKDGGLVAHEFDPETLRLGGPPRPVGDDAAGRNTIIGDALFSIGNDGTAVVWNGPLAATTELAWYDRSGGRLRVTGTPDRHFSLALSPDDRTIAIEVPDPEGPFYNIWTMDDLTGVKSRVTAGSLNWGPVWSPDGKRIAYGSLRGGPSEVVQSGVNGAPPETGVWKTRDFTGPTGWLPDGRSLILLDFARYRLGVLSTTDASAEPRWISSGGFVEGDGRVSPDGRWLAYTSNESGRWEVYVKRFPSLDRKWRVSPAGGSGPQWRRDSAELFYIDPDQQLMAVGVRQSATPVGPAARLFALPIVPTPQGIDPRLLYAPNSKGDRFLVNAALEGTGSSPLTVVLNASASLRPTRR